MPNRDVMMMLALALMALAGCTGRKQVPVNGDLPSRGDIAVFETGDQAAGEMPSVPDVAPADGPAILPDSCESCDLQPLPDEISPPDQVPIPDEISPPDQVLIPDEISPPEVTVVPAGCCQDASDCPEPDGGPDYACVFFDPGDPDNVGVCMPVPSLPGWCWQDADCGNGEYCHGAAACPCNLDCDMAYEGPGLCVPKGAECVGVDESWVKEVCNAAGTVIFDGEKCIGTCPGCCGCEPFCEFTFQSMDECMAACQPGCAVFDGGCDDALPEYPWWYFDGKDCIMEDSCVCEGCPGTFMSLEQCQNVCLGGPPDICPAYVSALADCPHYLHHGFSDDACDLFACDERCKSNDDCVFADGAFFGEQCVLGNCVFCWQDTQCQAGEVCRGGHCVDDSPMCKNPPPCNQEGCKLVYQSEVPCPVCVCDDVVGGIPCTEDFECMLLSIFPFKGCVYGRCAECISDDDCGWGRCLPPGMCYEMTPPMDSMYGTWLIGWFGALNHYSYFRFEPDGTLRRGSYPSGTDAWMDDIPQDMPCWPGVAPANYPLVGTWRPEVTASGFLVLDMHLNLTCDSGEGWQSRFMVNLSADGEGATFDDVDSDLVLDALKVPTDACLPDFSVCDTPGIL